MEITFTIPYLLMRDILAGIHARPYHVALGKAGVNMLPSGDLEILAQSFRLVHEGAVRGEHAEEGIRYELGFVPFSMRRPQIWKAVEYAARIEGDLPNQPTCSLLLGSGESIGLFSGIFTAGDQVQPVNRMRMPGAGMRCLPSADFRALDQCEISLASVERWSRLIGALGGKETWQRFTSICCCIIGVGRTGSILTLTLAKSGLRKLILLDPDVIEPSNLDAMDSVCETDVGRFKVEAIAESLRNGFPGIDIVCLPQSIATSQARIQAKAADVLISAVDDDAARIIIGGLAAFYSKPLLDIGVGIFRSDGPIHPAIREREFATSSRRLGADIRLIMPGDGCLFCWGGVADYERALRRLQTPEPRRPWNEERAGSLRSLNSSAAHLGIRLIEDMVAGRLAESVWLRLETDPQGIPSLERLSANRRPACPFCSRLGRGDALQQISSIHK